MKIRQKIVKNNEKKLILQIVYLQIKQIDL